MGMWGAPYQPARHGQMFTFGTRKSVGQILRIKLKMKIGAPWTKRNAVLCLSQVAIRMFYKLSIVGSCMCVKPRAGE